MSPPSGDIDFWKLLQSLWRGKWVILAGFVLGATLSIFIATRLPNEYRAVVLLAPAANPNGSGLSQLAGQFGGLASLAGIGLGGSDENEKTVIGMELLKSWGFQQQFVADNKLEVPVVAARGWDPKTNALKIDPDLYDSANKTWHGRFRSASGPVPNPTGWDLHSNFSKRVAITQDKKTNLITLSVQFYSPFLAKEWADGLVIAVNKTLQERDRSEARKNLQYLEQKIAQTGLTEMKSVFSRLIEEETKKLMLADVSDEYVFRTISRANVPQVKSRPSRAVIVATGTFLGGLFFTVGWLLRLNLTNYRRTVAAR